MKSFFKRTQSGIGENLTTSEQNFIETYLNEEVEVEKGFRGWIQVAYVTSEKKTSLISPVVTPLSKPKFNNRLIIIGKFKIFFIKEATIGNKKNIEKSIHYFDLTELFMELSNKNLLTLKSNKQTTLIQSTHILQIITDIRKAFSKISYGFGEKVLEFNVPNEYLQEIEYETPGVGNGIIDNYIAQCNYVSAPISYPFIQYVEDLISQHLYTMDLSLCPGIEPNTLVSVNIETIINSISLNTYFRGLIIKNGIYLSSLLKYNSCLTKLVLSNLEGNINWSLLGESLASNLNHCFQILDFSHNNLSTKDMASIAKGIQRFKHALIHLNLSSCNLSTKSITILFDGFIKNFACSLPIEYLDLSFNTFGEVGSNALATWLGKIREHSKLQSLLLSNTSINFLVIGSWLLNLKFLNFLDISGNKIGKDYYVLKAFLDATSSLNTIRLSGCKMSEDCVKDLMCGILNNPKTHHICIDLSGNELTSAIPIKQSLEGIYHLQSLDISNNKLKSEEIISILNALTEYCMTLTSLNIGKNIQPKELDLTELAKALGNYIKQNSNLKILSVEGAKGFRFYDSIVHFFTALSLNCSLEELNISGNKISDQGFFVLLDSLRTNKSLSILYIDGNCISLNGYLGLRLILRHNKKLKKIPLAHEDIEQVMTSLPAPRKNEFRQILNEILQILVLNGGTIDSFNPIDDSPKEVLPLAIVPDHLIHYMTFNQLSPQEPRRKPSYRLYIDNFNKEEEPQEAIVDEDVEEDLTIQLEKLKIDLIPSITVYELLGSGNFSQVYKGSWNGIAVALKKPSSFVQTSDFLEEVKILNALNHPNIIRIMGVHISKDKEKYIVMELASKGSLKTLLQSEKNKLTDEDIVGIAFQISSALRYLEAKNIIHRDLSARNLLISAQRNLWIPKLSDFGLSRENKEYSTSPEKSFPVKWSAPEVLQYRRYTHKSDVYSFGIMLWELITFGQEPFADMTNLEAMDAVIQGYKMPKPEKCPEWYYKLMLDCWEATPQKRPSFKEIFDVIKEQEGESIYNTSFSVGSSSSSPDPSNSEAYMTTY